jgi:hypothetical protein
MPSAGSESWSTKHLLHVSHMHKLKETRARMAPTEGASSAMKAEEDMATQRNGVRATCRFTYSLSAHRESPTLRILNGGGGRVRGGHGLRARPASFTPHGVRPQRPAIRLTAASGSACAEAPKGDHYSCEWEELDSDSAHAPSDGWTQKSDDTGSSRALPRGGTARKKS